KLQAALREHRSTALIVGETRTQRELPLAFRRAAAARIQLQGSNGRKVRAVVQKYSTAPRHDSASFTIRYGCGDSATELVVLAADRGLIEKRGSWYSVSARTIGLGLEEAALTVRADHMLRSYLDYTLRLGA